MMLELRIYAPSRYDFPSGTVFVAPEHIELVAAGKPVRARLLQADGTYSELPGDETCHVRTVSGQEYVVLMSAEELLGRIRGER
jgi:hypothetical protein